MYLSILLFCVNFAAIYTGGWIKKCCSPGSVLDDWYECLPVDDVQTSFEDKVFNLTGESPEIQLLESPMCPTRQLQEFWVRRLLVEPNQTIIQDHMGNSYSASQYFCIDGTSAELELNFPLIVLTCSEPIQESPSSKIGYIRKCCPSGQILNYNETDCVSHEDEYASSWIPARHVLHPNSSSPIGAFHYKNVEFPYFCEDGTFPLTEVPFYFYTNGSAVRDFKYCTSGSHELLEYHCADRIMNEDGSASDPSVLYCKDWRREEEPVSSKEVAKCCDDGFVFNIKFHSCMEKPKSGISPKTLFSDNYIGSFQVASSFQGNYHGQEKTEEPRFVRHRFLFSPTCQVVKLEKEAKHIYLSTNKTVYLKGRRNEVYIYKDYCVDSIEDSEMDSSVFTGIILCSQDRLVQAPQPGLIDIITEGCMEPKSLLYVLSILGCISLICMILTIMVYCLLPTLNTMHGKIQISNCVSIILLTFFFLVSVWSEVESGSEDRSGSTGCILLGYSIYYSSLSMFVWMTIMCLDILLAFFNTKMHLPKSIRKKFIIYSIAGWLGPLVACLLLLLLDHSLHADDPFKPDVGTHSCFIDAERKKLALYFHAPVLLLLLSNLGMFLLFNLKLWKHKMSTASVRHSRRRSNEISQAKRSRKSMRIKEEDEETMRDMREQFMLFTKMFLVLGILWVFECIHFFAHSHGCEAHSNVPSEFFFRLFDVLNQLRGVFIFLIFVCKKTIITEIKKLSACTRLLALCQSRPGLKSRGTRPLVTSINTHSELISYSATEMQKLHSLESGPGRKTAELIAIK